MTWSLVLKMQEGGGFNYLLFILISSNLDYQAFTFSVTVYIYFNLFNRSEREFLYEILGEVIKAGATTLNIPDTVGITLPSEFGQLIADIKANTPGIENVVISTHCQNDLGLSTANTLSVCLLFLIFMVVCRYVNLFLDSGSTCRC